MDRCQIWKEKDRIYLVIVKFKERCGTRDRKRANKRQKERKKERKKVAVKRRDTNKRERDKREDQYWIKGFFDGI